MSDWQPPPGMLKLTCLKCHRDFASPSHGVRTCPTCRAPHQQKRATAESSPFETVGAGRRIWPRPGR